MEGYGKTISELTRRILVLIPDHPEVLTMGSAWDLFKIEGFECDDLGPSMAQAFGALGEARRLYKEGRDEAE